jgi:8-oxo-dGTP pyrophosphatase MutT (NUDIX family)
MGIDLRKYWDDIIAPVLRGEQAPTIPQAVVLQEQHVLLVKRDNPMLWELPGGGVLPGETPEDAIMREVYEETGIRIKIVSLLG